ncbi:unnamed protein product [Caenorhabditis brenneri]
MGIVITISHSRSGIDGIEISLRTSRGIASLNYLVLFLANFLSILFIIYVFIFPSLRKNSNTYAVSAVSTIVVGLILLSPIVLEYQELLKFYESYKGENNEAEKKEETKEDTVQSDIWRRVHFNFYSKLQMTVNEFARTTFGIRNVVWIIIIFFAHCVMGIVITIAHFWSGIDDIKVSFSTPRGIASLNYLVLLLSIGFSICFIIYVSIIPWLRKNSNTYVFSAVHTIAVGLILLSPIVLEYQEFLSFYESYKELCIVQYICASIVLVCGMLLTVILWKIRVVKPKTVKPKIVKPKKKKPKKIQYKVIYGGEGSSTKKMITVDFE